MSVGDLKNNLRKLQSNLRRIKYEKDIDFESLSKGLVGSFLPIYHYLFLEYSRPVAEEIAKLDIELSGKTDLRFCEAMYKVLRELFSYKPPVTKDQLFASGFAERKVIMCSAVIQLVCNKHQTLMPKSAKSRPSSVTSKAAKLGPREASITASSHSNKENTSSNVQGSSLESKQSKPASLPQRPLPFDGGQVQVVNELRSAVASSVRSVFLPQTDTGPAPSRVAMDTGPAPLGSMPVSSRAGSKVTFREPADDVLRMKPSEASASRGEEAMKPDGWETMEAVVVTSGDSSGQLEHGYNPSRYEGDPHWEEDDETLSDSSIESPAERYDPRSHSQQAAFSAHTRPIDMVAVTPARPPQHIAMAPLPVVQKHVSNKALSPPATEVPPQPVSMLEKLEKSLGDVVSRLSGLENRLGVVEGLLSLQQEKARETEDMSHRTEAISAIQLETLLARMTLVENKVALVENNSSKAVPKSSLAQPNVDMVSQVRGEPAGSKMKSTLPALGMSPIADASGHHSDYTNTRDHLSASPVLRESRPLDTVRVEDSARQNSSTPVDECVAATDTLTHAATTSGTEKQTANAEGVCSDSANRGAATTSVGASDDRTGAVPKATTEPIRMSQAERIKNLMQSTEQMLNITVASPVKPQAVV